MYFPLRSRAESLRLILHYAGLPYTLRTVSFDEWADLKSMMPRGQLPVLQIDGEDELMSETADMACYLAGISGRDGLLPVDAKAALQAAELFRLTMTSPLSDLDAILNWHAKEEAAARAHPAISAAVRTLSPLKLNGKFFGGVAPFYADFAIWHAVDSLTKLDPKALGTLGNDYSSWYARVKELREIQAYLKCRPKAGTGTVGRPGSLMASSDLDGNLSAKN